MTVTDLGYYRELPHGVPAAPSLHAADPLADEVKERVVSYLRSTPVLVASGVLVRDVTTGEAIGAQEAHTDGSWVWYSDLPQYVERYDAPLPTGFVEVASAGGPPEMSVEAIMDVVRRMERR